jgi:hypothetical protein
MVAEPRPLVELDEAVREWARDLVPSLGRRVFFDYRDNAHHPQASAHYITGPQESALYQFNVWGRTWLEANTAASDLEQVADNSARHEVDGVIVHGTVLVDRRRYEPDEESRQPRFIVEVRFVATADGSEDAS